jgi:hypothetical protein
MAKSLLSGYRIGEDVIDRVAASNPPTPLDKPLPVFLHPAAEPERTRPADEKEQPGLFRGDEGEPSSEAPGEPESDPEAPAPDTEVLFERDGLFHVFTIGQNVYRLGGVKSLFVTSLRVNVRATNGRRSYYDSLDLYTARARTAFALAVSRSWGAEPSRVERDLVRILERLEAERDEALRSGSAKQEIQMSPADRELGLSLLKDPRLFDRVVDDLSTLGYVGEDLNKILLYLCASSRKLDDPISVLLLSQSASGKSFLVDTVKRLMPPEDVVAVTSLSDQALNYIEDLSHKFLVLGEAVHGEVVEHQIREMLSGKELSRLVTVKDPESGRMQSRVVRTPVIVASVMSGTNHAVNPENSSRCFLANTDESREQTERIHAHQRGKYSLERLRSGRAAAEAIVRTHQAAQRLLQKRLIVNDFAPLLSFPSALMRTRRDHDRFLDLIACVCFVRQYQKPEERDGDLSFIRCDLADYRVAYRVMVEGVMSSTMRELPRGAVGLYDEIRAWASREAARQGVSTVELSFTQRQVRELSGLSHTWVKYAMRQLVEYEYVTVAKGGAERSRAFYRLREDARIAQVDLSMIPTPDEMAEKLACGK